MLKKLWAFAVVSAICFSVLVVSGDISDPKPANTPPIADVGPDQTIFEGESLTLDIGNSTDPDGNITLYEIDFGDGANYAFEPAVFPDFTILVYSTADEELGNYRKMAFDTDLVNILTSHGYTVNLTDRYETPILTSSLLYQHGQLWFISADFDIQGDLTAEEVQLILEYARLGGGLFIVGDHGGMPFEAIHDANQISEPLGVHYWGIFGQGPNGQPISPIFVPHEVTSGLTQICGHSSAAHMDILSSDVTVLATYNSEPMIAVRDDEAGRILFENTLVRFMNENYEMPYPWVNVADTPQYVRNAADFLAPKGYGKPPLVGHQYGDDGKGIDGNYTITLEVTDDNLETSEDKMVVTVLNTPPEISVSQEVTTFRDVPIFFTGRALDNGSDDLTFYWDFGDGSGIVQSTYYNNGFGPDLYPSPGPTYPFERTDLEAHSFGQLGTYLTDLTVVDDDGGTSFAQITVHIVPFLPPRNLTTRTESSDVVLSWLPSPSIGVDRYLIYAGSNPISLDLDTPTGQVSSFNLGWRDVGVSPILGEKYYTVRAYNQTYSLLSRTSNSAGKFTKRFNAGLTPFSLPLEPFGDYMVSDYLENIPNTEYVNWMDENGKWVKHEKGMQQGEKDTLVAMGKGYEILLSDEATFAFCGLPGGMINYTEGLGEDPGFTSSLNVELDGSDVVLSWNNVLGAVGYFVFGSSTRGGLFEPSLPPLTYTDTTTWTDQGRLSTQGEFYYFVMPIDEFGERGSSTYSVGVQTIRYQDGSDTFSLPLNTSLQLTLDDLCDDVPTVVGMAYMIFEVWKFHARQMPARVYDVTTQLSVGYQISIESPSPILWTFVGY